jgi:cytochrome c oxidase cbb3-type subunit 2
MPWVFQLAKARLSRRPAATLAPASRVARALALSAALATAVATVGGVGRVVLAAADSTAASAQPAASATAPRPAPRKIEVTPPGADYNQRERLLERGRIAYGVYCVGCHGVTGDGKGPAAQRLIIKPRDFTSGIYKFRSTDASSLPMESDLHRTITRGLARVSMPAFPLLPEQEKVALIEYLKAFYPKWDEEQDRRTLVFVPRAPADLSAAERVARGRLVYLGMGCGNCHGRDGAGDGATLTSYTDAWGNPQPAFNFTRGRLKGGDDPEDVYRTFHTGLRSIMPAYGGDTLAFVSLQQVAQQKSLMLPGDEALLDRLKADFPAALPELAQLSVDQKLERARRNSWDLVSYILSLRRDGPPAQAPRPPAPAAGGVKPVGGAQPGPQPAPQPTAESEF